MISKKHVHSLPLFVHYSLKSSKSVVLFKTFMFGAIIRASTAEHSPASTLNVYRKIIGNINHGAIKNRFPLNNASSDGELWVVAGETEWNGG